LNAAALAALGFVRKTPSTGCEAPAMKSRPNKEKGVRKPKRMSVGEILRIAYMKCARDKFTRQAMACLFR
jgi:hypothetical protein